MVARSSESKPATRRRRPVRRSEEDVETPDEPVQKTSDDASDVIFEESGEVSDEAPRPKGRRKKAATTRRRKTTTRRRTADKEEEPSDERDVEVVETREEQSDERDDAQRTKEVRSDDVRADSGEGRSDGEPRPEQNRDSEDGDGRPRRRRRRRGRGGRGQDNGERDAGGSSGTGTANTGAANTGAANTGTANTGAANDDRGSRRDDRGGGYRDDRGGGYREGGSTRRGGRRGQRGGGGGSAPAGGPARGQRGGGGGGGQGRRDQRRTRSVLPSDEVVEGTFEAVLELHPKGYGFLRSPEKNYAAQESDPFVPSSLVEKFALREGVLIKGEVGAGVRNQGPRLHEISEIEGEPPEEWQQRKAFEDLTPITPDRKVHLETTSDVITMRVMDMLTPVGKGQRALLVAPPRTGKTMLLQDIADAVSANHPEIHLMVLLIDERPEEVTEMQRRVKGEVIASSMDRDVENHVRISQLIIERAKRMAECGKDVFILMDSITRMARAFNKWTTGGRGDNRTMSGGLHVKALDIPKKLFGTARQFDGAGSVTIVATALIETDSRMDEVIFQEFKGTGNMELVLSRDLADRRIWPAIDITRSGTRHEEKLFSRSHLDSVTMLRRSLISLSPVEAMESLTRTLERFATNDEFLERVKTIL